MLLRVEMRRMRYAIFILSALLLFGCADHTAHIAVPQVAPASAQWDADVGDDAKIAIASLSKKVPESKRRSIFAQMGPVEDNAAAEAQREIPDPSSDNPHAAQVLVKQAGLSNKLIDAAHHKLAQQNSISDEELATILTEGALKHWPTR